MYVPALTFSSLQRAGQDLCMFPGILYLKQITGEFLEKFLLSDVGAALGDEAELEHGACCSRGDIESIFATFGTPVAIGVDGAG